MNDQSDMDNKYSNDGISDLDVHAILNAVLDTTLKRIHIDILKEDKSKITKKNINAMLYCLERCKPHLTMLIEVSEEIGGVMQYYSTKGVRLLQGLKSILESKAERK